METRLKIVHTRILQHCLKEDACPMSFVAVPGTHITSKLAELRKSVPSIELVLNLLFLYMRCSHSIP